MNKTVRSIEKRLLS